MYSKYFEQANQYYKNGNYNEAIKDYKKCIDFKFFETECFYNIGVCYIKKSNNTNKRFLNLAIKFFNKVLEKDSSHYKCLFNIAHVYDLLKNYKKAYIYINRASIFNTEYDLDCDKLFKKINKEIINEIQLGEV